MSLNKWQIYGMNLVGHRNNPTSRNLKSYEVPIHGLTDYIGLGLTIKNNAIAKNISLRFRYDSFSNAMVENNRYLFSVIYIFDVLDQLLQN